MVPTTSAERSKLLGDAGESTTVFEGRRSEVPTNALHSKEHDAGLKIEFRNGSKFLVGAGDPFTLEINHESSFNLIDESVYELTPLP